MTTWPSGNKAVTTTTDNASDSISGSRDDLNKTVSNVNDIIDMFNIPGSPTDDYILKYDSSTGKFQMEADASGAGGLANPATENLDMAGYDIEGIDELYPNTSSGLQIRTSTSPTSNSIVIDSSGGARITSPDSDLILRATGTGSNILLSAPHTEVSGPMVLASYTVATLPTVYPTAGIAYCTDETGGATLVFYDGTNWRRVQDRAVAS